MTYRLIFAPSFLADIDRQLAYLRDEQLVSVETIDAWFGRLYAQLDGIEAWPRLYPVDEAYSAAVGRESHKINFGDHLVFYQVDDAGREVNVVALVHGATRQDA